MAVNSCAHALLLTNLSSCTTDATTDVISIRFDDGDFMYSSFAFVLIDEKNRRPPINPLNKIIPRKIILRAALLQIGMLIK